MNCVSKVLWECERCSITLGFVDDCYLSQIDDIRGISRCQGEGIVCEGMQMLGDVIGVAEAKSFAEVCVSEGYFGWDTLKQSVNWA